MSQQKIFTEACKGGFLKILDAIDYSEIDIHFNEDEAFREACICENMQGIQYLLDLEKKYGQINIHAKNNKLFYDLCKQNKINMVKFLLSLEDSHGQINIHAYNPFSTPFSAACFCATVDKNLEMLKLLLSLESTHGRINIHQYGEWAFYYACVHNHTHLINFLLSLEPVYGPIDIHCENDRTFYEVGRQGNHKLLKRLLGMKSTHGRTDIHTYNSGVFITACVKGYLKIINTILDYDDEFDYHRSLTYREIRTQNILKEHKLFSLFLDKKFSTAHYLIKCDKNFEWENFLNGGRNQTQKYRNIITTYTKMLTIVHFSMLSMDSDIFDSNVMNIVTSFIFV